MSPQCGLKGLQDIQWLETQAGKPALHHHPLGKMAFPQPMPGLRRCATERDSSRPSPSIVKAITNTEKARHLAQQA